MASDNANAVYTPVVPIDIDTDGLTATDKNGARAIRDNKDSPWIWTAPAPAAQSEGGRRRRRTAKGGRKSKKCGWGGKKSKKQKGGKRKSQKKGGKHQKKQQQNDSYMM